MSSLTSKQMMKCVKHPNQKVKFIILNNENENTQQTFYCNKCFSEDTTLKGIDCLLMNEITEYNSDSVILKWPPVNNYQILQNLQQAIQDQQQNESIEQRIEKFFTAFKISISNKIDSCQKSLINKVNSLPFEKETVLKQYQELSKITEFQDHIQEQMQNNNNSNNQGQNNCKLLIENMARNKEQNTQQLEQILNSYLSAQNYMDTHFLQFNNIQANVINMIDSIDFLNSNNNNNNNNNIQNNNRQQQNRIKQQQQQQQVEQRIQMQIGEEKGYQRIMRLIENKSNYCSQEFLNELENILKQLNPFLENFTSSENMFIEGKKPIDFSKLKEDEFQLINDYTIHKQQLISNANYKQGIVNSELIQSIKLLLSNKFNFVNNNFINQFEQQLIETYPFLSSIEYSNSFNDQFNFNCFNSLTDSSFNDFIILAKQIQQINSNIQNNQNNNNNIILSNEQQIVKQQLIKLNSFEENDINNILIKYPIFDLIKIKEFMLKKTKFNYGETELEIKINSNQQYQVKQISGTWHNCISNIILKRNKKYLFRIQLEGKDNDYFAVGLIDDSEKDTKYGYDYQMCCKLRKQDGYYILYQNKGIQVEKKGSGFTLCNQNTIDLRVSIGENIVEVHDYPQYKYCLSLNNAQDILNKYQLLRLYLGLYDENAIMTVIHAGEVDSF